MEKLLSYFALAYVGMALHALKKLNEVSKKPGFTMGGFIKDQLFTTISAFIATGLTIYLIWDNPLLQEQLPLTSLTAVGVGYVGQSVLLSFLAGKFKDKKNEKDSDNSNNPS